MSSHFPSLFSLLILAAPVFVPSAQAQFTPVFEQAQLDAHRHCLTQTQELAKFLCAARDGCRAVMDAPPSQLVLCSCRGPEQPLPGVLNADGFRESVEACRERARKQATQTCEEKRGCSASRRANGLINCGCWESK